MKNYPSNSLRGGGFANGIKNSLEDFKNSMMYLGKLTGQNFSGVYTTSFGLFPDFTNHFGAHYEMNGYNAVRHTHETWNHFFKNAPPDALFLQIAHSNGCTNVRNALIDYPPELRNRIVVLAVAPGSFIDKDLCRQVWHLCSHWDPVPKGDPSGFQRCKDTVFFVDTPPPQNATGYLIAPLYGIMYCHGFESPIYKPYIKRLCDDFFNGEY